VKRCDKCQRHEDKFNAPSSELGALTTPWPFARWGMDLLGPFHKGAGQVKFLIVAIDYFAKWIEADPLAKISAANVIKFFKTNILSKFSVHRTSKRIS